MLRCRFTIRIIIPIICVFYLLISILHIVSYLFLYNRYYFNFQWDLCRHLLHCFICNMPFFTNYFQVFFSLSLILSSLIMTCLGMVFFELILFWLFWASWIYKFMSFVKFGGFTAIVFQIFFNTSHFLLSWDSSGTNVKFFWYYSTCPFLVLFQSFFCSSDYIISIGQNSYTSTPPSSSFCCWAHPFNFLLQILCFSVLKYLFGSF